jgi:alcohol dehydrogenase YqhD (iron-dependent ADH family)
MEIFNIYNPVNLHFGKDCLEKLPKSISKYGEKILLVYGKSSIINSGLYKHIKNLLSEFEIIEYSGIKPNPIIEDVDQASIIAKENNVDIILAVGGGSVIDSAKIISIGAKVEHSAWDFIIGKEKPKSAIPLISVLTLAATGTEMNAFAVVQNTQTMQKIGYGYPPLTFPKESFLDPQHTTTVNREQTVNGIVDIIAHALEAYFAKGNSPLADKFVVSIIEEAMLVAPALLRNLDNYELRARIMYAATIALNGTTAHGRASSGDWGAHSIGHELSLLFDVAHGASLSVAYPAWMKLMEKPAKERIEELGSALFGAQSVDETIEEFKAFFKSIGSPISLTELNISENHFDSILKQLKKNRVSGMNYQFENYEELVELMR